MIELILATLLWFPHASVDAGESHDARRARLLPFAALVAALPPHRAAAVLAVGYHESRFAAYVAHGCEDVPDGAAGCDRDRWGRPRALGYTQLWRVACPSAWKLPHNSPEQLAAIVTCTDKRLRHSLRRCRGQHPLGDVAGMFAGYRGIDCTWEGKDMAKRVNTYHRVLARVSQ